MPPKALDLRVRQAELDSAEGRGDVALEAVLAALADGRRDSPEETTTPVSDPWPLLVPEALLRCHAILNAAGHAQAVDLQHELQRRLRQQCAQQPDEAGRQGLLHGVPHWRETVRRFGVAA